MILKNPPVQKVNELNQLFLASMKRRNKKNRSLIWYALRKENQSLDQPTLFFRILDFSVLTTYYAQYQVLKEQQQQ